MSGHALLSPSSAHRWMNCPLAPRLEATLPPTTTVYAKEGTLAHTICEITAKKYFKKIKAAEYNKLLKSAKKHELWDDEMLDTAQQYTEHLSEISMGFEHEPYIAFEVRVDISGYVPDAFGRCDCVMISKDTLVITDYKHGKGEKVCAENNPQLMLYALGALHVYRPIFGNKIQNVLICIDQPRIRAYEMWECKVDDLVAWGENEVKPKAQKAFLGVGTYKAGNWCRFCRANGICKAQAQQHLSTFSKYDTTNAALLSTAEMGKVLTLGADLVGWYNAVEKKAFDALLEGNKIPGFKLVEGRSSRAWTNQDEALEKLEQNGIERAMIYDNVPKTLSQLEKMIGAKKFAEMVGSYIMKPPGRPTLAPEADKRKEYSSAAADFAGVAQA